MRLISDDKNQVYYWVDKNDVCVSPHFDYEADAIKWYSDTVYKEL